MTTERQRKGDWFQTFTGRAWWPEDPNPDDVCIDDIAHGLAYQCRYNGQCREFYSTGEHSSRVAMALYPEGVELALHGLLHDAAEAYLGDIVRPVKRRLPIFYELESRNLAAIYSGLGLTPPISDQRDRVAEMDLILLATERRDLMADPPLPWVSLEKVEPLPGVIAPRTAEAAGYWFYTLYRDFTEELRA